LHTARRPSGFTTFNDVRPFFARRAGVVIYLTNHKPFQIMAVSSENTPAELVAVSFVNQKSEIVNRKS